MAKRLQPRLAAAAWLTLAVAGLGYAAAPVPANADRVVFYTEPNFRGESMIVEAGATLENLDQVKRADRRPWTFGISSVRVEGAARATVYSAPGFSGDRLEIGANIADLYGEQRGREQGATWDRSIASLAVAGTRPVVVSRPPVRQEPPPTTVYVVPSPPPPPVVHQVRPRYDARTADVTIHRAYREVLQRNPDPEGLRHFREILLRDGWSEQQLIAHLQRSNEARSVNPDEAIAKAYREVLGREPDPGGLAHYRKLWREGWTQGSIRDDLRRSTEGRSSHIRTAITRAYRDLLGREPDPEGYAAYEKMMREKGVTEQEIRRSIMSSEEYRKRRQRPRTRKARAGRCKG